MKRLPLILAVLMFFPVAAPSTAAPKIVTAAQVNGTWRTKTGDFKVLALGRQKLRIEFSGTYESRSSRGTRRRSGRKARKRTAPSRCGLQRARCS